MPKKEQLDVMKLYVKYCLDSQSVVANFL